MKLAFRYRLKWLPYPENYSRWFTVGKDQDGNLVTSIYEKGFNFETEEEIHSTMLDIEILTQYPQIQFRKE